MGTMWPSHPLWIRSGRSCTPYFQKERSLMDVHSTAAKGLNTLSKHTFTYLGQDPFSLSFSGGAVQFMGGFYTINIASPKLKKR